MKLESLKKLFVHELKDLYSAETQLIDALPKMIEKANDDELKIAFDDHLKQTRQQITRLEQIFGSLDFQPGGHKCKGMEGLINEGEDLLSSDIAPEVMDAALIGAAQRIEHYEIAGYGTAHAFATKLGDHAAAELLQKTLDEEADTDEKLSRLAEKSINFKAMNP